jgi:hypothetical protein
MPPKARRRGHDNRLHKDQAPAILGAILDKKIRDVGESPMNRALVRLLLTSSLLAACAFMAGELVIKAPMVPTRLEIGAARCGLEDLACLTGFAAAAEEPRQTERALRAPARPIKRLAHSGYDCRGMIRAVLRSASSCDPTWRPGLSRLEQARP